MWRLAPGYDLCLVFGSFLSAHKITSHANAVDKKPVEGNWLLLIQFSVKKHIWEIPFQLVPPRPRIFLLVHTVSRPKQTKLNGSPTQTFRLISLMSMARRCLSICHFMQSLTEEGRVVLWYLYWWEWRVSERQQAHISKICFPSYLTLLLSLDYLSSLWFLITHQQNRNNFLKFLKTFYFHYFFSKITIPFTLTAFFFFIT